MTTRAHVVLIIAALLLLTLFLPLLLMSLHKFSCSSVSSRLLNRSLNSSIGRFTMSCWDIHCMHGEDDGRWDDGTLTSKVMPASLANFSSLPSLTDSDSALYESPLCRLESLRTIVQIITIFRQHHQEHHQFLSASSRSSLWYRHYRDKHALWVKRYIDQVFLGPH